MQPDGNNISPNPNPNPSPNPVSYGAPSPQSSQLPPDDFTPDRENKTKKIVIISALAAVVILTIIAVAASLSGGNKKKPADNNQSAQSSELTRNPTAIDVENVNNSISSNITSLDDEKDFPATNLDDKNLGL